VVKLLLVLIPQLLVAVAGALETHLMLRVVAVVVLLVLAIVLPQATPAEVLILAPVE
jgi:hypothetical protein